MLISELIQKLEREKEKYGDIQVTMTGTFLKDGYSQTDSDIIADVFESTVETLRMQDSGELGDRIRLFWQC